MDTLKNISIKANTVKRYTKDINYYKKELEGLHSKREKLMCDPEACSHVLKKQDEVIKETEVMIPECEGRLQAALADLQEFLTCHCNIGEIVDSEVFKEAQSLIGSKTL